MPCYTAARIAGHHATSFAAWRRTVATILILVSPWSFAASELNVPYIGEPADRSLSPLQEAALGREVMRQLLAANYALEDTQIEDYIGDLGARLLQQTNEQEIPFRFFMVRDNAINAFALPGGYVGFNAGLLLASSSESELAGVMGHEIAHVTQRHIARSMDETRGWDIATVALLMAALIAGAADPELAQAALGLGMSAAIQKQINFTRANELEADRLGIKTLSKAGFDPQGMASFFHRLSQKAQLYGEAMPEILRTHPVNTTRISEAQARAADLPLVSVQSSLAYRLMQARARVLMTDLASDAENYFQALNKENSSVENQYGLALAQIRQRRFSPALSTLQQLSKTYPDTHYFKAALGELYIHQGQYTAAIEHLNASLKQHQAQRTLQLDLAEAYIRNDQPKVARQLLLESGLLMKDDSEVYRLLARAARNMNEGAEAHFQLSGYAHSRGDYVDALRQLRNGLRASPLQEHDRKRLNGRLAQYLDEIPDSERKRAREEARHRRAND